MKYRIEYQWSDGNVETSRNTYDKATAESLARDYMIGSILGCGIMMDIDINPPRVVSWELIPEV